MSESFLGTVDYNLNLQLLCVPPSIFSGNGKVGREKYREGVCLARIFQMGLTPGTLD